MEVGAKAILIMNPFADLFFVVSISIDDLTEWFLVILEEGTALVVLKAKVGFIEIFVMNFNITDKAVVSLIESVVSHDT